MNKGHKERPKAVIQRKRTLVLDEREVKKGGYYRFEKSFEHEEVMSDVISQEPEGAR